MNKKIGILGMGSYVPEKVLTNADLEKMVDTSDEWITTRTGIKERHIAAPDEFTSDLAVAAARRAIADGNINKDDISLIIVGTATGDYLFPSTACLVQNKLGIKEAVGFDVSAACSGFIYGVEIARQFILTGKYKKALVIGAEKLSSITDYTDRNICVLLGDGAGACVLGEKHDNAYILDSYMRVDGSCGSLLKLPAGGSAMPASHKTVDDHLHYMKMEGRDVFKRAVQVMCDSSLTVLDNCGLTADDINWFIPHQANIRIIKAIAKRLKISMDRVYTNVDRFGNMSAASIPVALDEAVKNGIMKKGDRVLLVAFGAGFTWGSIILQL